MMDMGDLQQMNPATRFYKEFINKVKNMGPGEALIKAECIVREKFRECALDGTKWNERIDFKPSDLVNVTRFEAYRYIVMNWLMYKIDEECPRVPYDLLI